MAASMGALVAALRDSVTSRCAMYALAAKMIAAPSSVQRLMLSSNSR